MNTQLKQSAYISRLCLINYKKYPLAIVEFSKGLNILVGPNNAGKTTILDAIDILLGERNLSPLSIKRSHFNSYESGADNVAKLILEVVYPVRSGTKVNEINFIKQLKSGKGSSRSKLPHSEVSNHISIDDLCDESFAEMPWTYIDDTPKTGFDIKTIFLVTNLSIDAEYNSNVSYDIYMNVEKKDPSNNVLEECYKIIGVSGSQRSSIFNYLFLPANRIDNKSLTEITEYNWLGRYIKNYVKVNNKNSEIKSFLSSHKFPSEILDIETNKILSSLYTSNEKLTIDLINVDDADTVITNARFYLQDGYNDEIANKAHGLQSATTISLFAGWCQFQAKSMPHNSKVSSMWNTVLAFEEPESHFHFPIRNKLMHVLQEGFLKNGAQILISTHDNTFMNWHYVSNASIIFPNSSNNNHLKSINLSEILDDKAKRMVRFNANGFFSDIVMIVEGQEEVCLDLLYQAATEGSLQEEGIILTRSVGGIRTNGSSTADLQAGGGKDQIIHNAKFFQDLNIQPLCMVDIDCLFGDAPSVVPLYKQITGEDIVLSQKYAAESDNSYLELQKWWEENKDSTNLTDDISKLEKAGIYVFPGDFESLFNPDYLSKFEDPSDANKLIKEKFSYDTKYFVEANTEDVDSILHDEGMKFLKNSVSKIRDFANRIRLSRSDDHTDPQVPLDVFEDTIDAE